MNTVLELYKKDPTLENLVAHKGDFSFTMDSALELANAYFEGKREPQSHRDPGVEYLTSVTYPGRDLFRKVLAEYGLRAVPNTAELRPLYTCSDIEYPALRSSLKEHFGTESFIHAMRTIRTRLGQFNDSAQPFFFDKPKHFSRNYDLIAHALMFVFDKYTIK